MNRLLGTAILALLLFAGVQTWRLNREQAQKEDAAFGRDSAIAAADTTRRLYGKILAHLGDTLMAYQRRVIQEEQRADKLDKDLNLERRAKLRITARFDSLLATLKGTPTTENAEGVRESRFHVRQPPYTVDATARLPRPPVEGSLLLSIGLDPLSLHGRLGCGKATAGVRSAEFTVLGPPWADLRLDSLSQDREVCNPRRAASFAQKAKISAVAIGVWELGKTVARALLGK